MKFSSARNGGRNSTGRSDGFKNNGGQKNENSNQDADSSSEPTAANSNPNSSAAVPAAPRRSRIISIKYKKGSPREAENKCRQEASPGRERPMVPVSSTRSAHAASNGSIDSGYGKKGNGTNGAKNELETRRQRILTATVFEEEAKTCLNKLNLKYCLDLPLDKRDAVMVMQGWNKVLAFKAMFEEALLCKWRILVAKSEHSLQTRDPPSLWTIVNEKCDPPVDVRKSSSVLVALDQVKAKTNDEMNEALKAHWASIDLVEKCQDPIAQCFGTRIFDLEALLVGLVDTAVRNLCPHTQTVAREAYRSLNEAKPSDHAALHLECRSLSEYFRLFARCGISPSYWVLFCDAFVWTLETHVPYADDHDVQDLKKRPRQGTFARFIAGHIAREAIHSAQRLQEELKGKLFSVAVPRFWHRIVAGNANKAMIGETFYRSLLTNYPDLLDYFAKADMDSLAIHLVAALDLCVESIPKIGESRTSFRGVLDHLGELHRKLGIPTYSYALVGSQLLDTLNPFFKEEEKLMKNDPIPVTAKELEHALATLYGEVMSFTHHPMMREEKMNSMAESFFDSVAEELKWSPGRLSKRLLEVKLEIGSTGTYSHTAEELEVGARLAWRNSAKCVGRISWNTLMVRDCRHVEKPHEIFREVEEHLKLATGGTNIQSVMTVFKPKKHNTWGVRFWTSQFVRYAGYKQDNGEVLGDPANADMTEYLLRRKLWTPPKKRTAFDVLPLVLKMPGEDTPYIHELPPDCIHEVKIEHPKFPKIAKLGARWGTVPAICNFNMNLGGVDYQCCPFNGWFVSTEVVRNLLERYKVGEKWAKIMQIDTNEDMWETKVAAEVDTAVLFSFRKNHYTVVDPASVGKSFCTHVVRERETFGRECPAQWSWIGGFLGYTNVTWHLEMRDFLVFPQYEYCADSLLLMDDKLEDGRGESHQRRRSSLTLQSPAGAGAEEMVRVLIAYGSETGNSEAVALRLARLLSILDPIVKCLNDVTGLAIIKDQGITHMLVICSTFGKGELPRNASNFLSVDLSPGCLRNTQVAILALGSTLYPDYCRAGVLLEEKLQKAGKKTLAPLQKTDAAVGAEGNIHDWCSLIRRLVLPPHLETRMKAELGSENDPATHHTVKWMKAKKEVSIQKEIVQFAEDESCLCVANEELLGSGDIGTRSTRRVVFRLAKSDSYQTGDHLCVMPLNSLGMVQRFASCFEKELKLTAMASGRCPYSQGKQKSDENAILWQMKQPFRLCCREYGRDSQVSASFKTPVTLFEALQSQIDLALQASIVPDLISMLNRRLQMLTDSTADGVEILSADPLFVKYCELADPIIKGISDEKSQATCNLTDQYPTILDFFEEFSPLFFDMFTPAGKGQKPAPVVPLGEVLALVPRLQPRYYSISSSPHSNPKEVAITVGVLHKTSPTGVIVDGICSNYLARLRPGVDRALISIRESTFRGPDNLQAPVIMIGPGTGLAPMMGFIEDRSTMMKNNKFSTWKQKERPCHLFFGCKTDGDRIYKDAIEKYEDADVIKFHLALSRAPKVPKMYVQDLLRSMGKEISAILLQENAKYYICGDSKMADDCYEVCIEILRKHNSMSRVAAVQHLKRMRAEDRWQMDLWGIFYQFQESRDAISIMKKKAAKVWLSRFAEND